MKYYIIIFQKGGYQMNKIIGWILLVILAFIPGTIALIMAADEVLTGKLYFGSVIFVILLYGAISLINKSKDDV